jgi:hypothetical protein
VQIISVHFGEIVPSSSTFLEEGYRLNPEQIFRYFGGKYIVCLIVMGFKHSEPILRLGHLNSGSIPQEVEGRKRNEKSS